MSAVDAGQRRFGLGHRLARLVGESVLFSGLRRTFSNQDTQPATTWAYRPRAQSLLARHISSLGAAPRVLELVADGAKPHADWLCESVVGETLSGRLDDLMARLQAMPSSSIDAVFSLDVIDSVTTPRRLADEIMRVLRPGGVTFHSLVYSSGSAACRDGRATPEGLKALFSDLDCVTAEFDATACPRDRHQRRGDIFSASREGWRVHYAGRKAALR